VVLYGPACRKTISPQPTPQQTDIAAPRASRLTSDLSVLSAVVFALATAAVLTLPEPWAYAPLLPSRHLRLVVTWPELRAPCLIFKTLVLPPAIAFTNHRWFYGWCPPKAPPHAPTHPLEPSFASIPRKPWGGGVQAWGWCCWLMAVPLPT